MKRNELSAIEQKNPSSCMCNGKSSLKVLWLIKNHNLSDRIMELEEQGFTGRHYKYRRIEFTIWVFH
jgi:hypothetical protein